jgi:4Fe-4S ferredoxin
MTQIPSPASGKTVKSGADCPQEPGRVAPVIASHKCEGAGDCAAVCPYDVFELRKLTEGELGALPWMAWIKVKVHGGKQAFVIHPEACHACGLCVTACPEHAIRLLATDGERTAP